MTLPPRTFTPAELTQTLTLRDYWNLSPADQAAFDAQLTDLWVANTARADAAYIAGDDDRVGSNRRYELGE